MQSTKNILLVRPSNFVFNTQTAQSNTFQNTVHQDTETIRLKAFDEFEHFAQKLKSKGVNVLVFDDTPTPTKPDAVFPNNWVTFHPDGKVILYPMLAKNRRYEKRLDIIESLKEQFEITEVIDLSKYEQEDKFLEGTGSVVFDHKHKIAYACLSPRTDKELFLKVAHDLQYKPIYFHAHDEAGVEIYHTNVMMSVGEKFAVIYLDGITNEKEKELVYSSLTQTGHEVIEISSEQMNHFAGNMLSIKTNDKKNILVLSQSAFGSLTDTQKNTLEKYCELFPLSIETIETIGGGSARCMMAEIFLKRKNV